MSTLAETLDGIRQAGDAKRPPELTAAMKRATADLETSGIMERVLRAGQLAPFFARPNLECETVRLSALLKKGPVIVSFFRGRW